MKFKEKLAKYLSILKIVSAPKFENMTKEEAIKYVQNHPGHYKSYHLDSKYHDDMYDDGERSEYIPSLADIENKWRKDKDVVLAAILTDYHSYDFADKKLKNDPDLIEAYNKRNIKKFEENSEYTLDDPLGDIKLEFIQEPTPEPTPETDPEPEVEQTPITSSYDKEEFEKLKEKYDGDDLEKTAMAWDEYKGKSR